MSLLQQTYDEVVAAGSYEFAVRVYMIYLLACTLFADKSGVYIDAQYVCLFSSLDVTSWAWGCVALTILYASLGMTKVFETRQLVGYLRLL